MRNDNRGIDEIRKVTITRDYLIHAEGSVLVTFGNTKVICTASVEEKIPHFRMESKLGWVTAEYAMLPRSTNTRNSRRTSGRSQEIQRLIGRSLRSIMDFKELGERQIIIDCDVIQADGGTRTASITGAYVALYDACRKLLDDGLIDSMPIKHQLAAVSVGVVNEIPVLDLNYEEDSSAQVDMNIVMASNGGIIEIQGTGEERPFSKKEFDDLMNLSELGINKLFKIQRECLGIEE